MSKFLYFSGKTAFVIGSEGLLGKQFVKTLENAGCIVAGIDKNLNKDNICKIDVTKKYQLKKFIEYFIKDYKKIDILVNCFAVNPQISEEKNDFENYSLEKWNNTVNVNLTGTFLTCKEVGKVMVKQQSGGVIVNVTSQLGLVAPDQSIYDNGYIKPADYCVSASGIIELTKYLASYWRDKIRVNCLIPSMIYNKQDKKFIKRVKKKIPLGRMSELDEFNKALLFLCSEASSYMTGQNLIMDGGYTII